MSSEHYFSETPSTEFKPKSIKVQLLGRSYEVETAGGTFSPDRIDRGTAVLLTHLDVAPRGGNLLGIGCGWGPIALSLALHAPQATVWAVDVNERSMALTRANAERLGLTNVKVCRPDEVPSELTFDGIWSNPPIRVGKEILHDILLTWLPRLSAGASAYLVVQKNLGSDSLHRWLEETLQSGFETSRVDTAKAFRVLRTWNRG
jgi:16S rRNA (guanine1207-N2)-methyltransferase